MTKPSLVKKKFNKGSYRDGVYVIGGVDREMRNSFLVPCPGSSRDAPTLLPIIEKWVLPGSIVYTEEWGAYNDLMARGYTT